MKGKVRVGAVDCTQHQATCSEFNVRAPAEKGQHRSREDMHADRTLQLQLMSYADGKTVLRCATSDMQPVKFSAEA